MVCISGCLIVAAACGAMPLFEPHQAVVSFALTDRDDEIPQLTLFSEPGQADTAASINYWRGTTENKKPGVAVVFRGIRFLRSTDDADQVKVRLIGIKNEIEMKETVSLAALESGRAQDLHFGPVAMGYGPIAGTSDVEMTMKFIPQRRALRIARIAGTLEWRRGFADPQSDGGAIDNIHGHIAELPAGSLILKAE